MIHAQTKTFFPSLAAAAAVCCDMVENVEYRIKGPLPVTGYWVVEILDEDDGTVIGYL